MKYKSPKCDLFILSAITDLSFLSHTIPHQIRQCKVNGKKYLRIDTSPISGYYKNNRETSKFSELEIISDFFQKERLIDEVIPIKYKKELINSAYLKHFANKFSETHCFRGYPYYGSIIPFEFSDAEYIAHLDSDMLIYQKEGFDWIQESINLMENNPDIICCLPLSGPPLLNGQLHQDTTKFKYDNKRGVYLFKNFTSRIFVMNTKRFTSLLPMKIKWLSWREPFKSKFFGNGKMLCWEVSVTKALENSSYYRADLANHAAWSLHPVERGGRFNSSLTELIGKIEDGFFPEKQRGHYDLNLDWWV